MTGAAKRVFGGIFLCIWVRFQENFVTLRREGGVWVVCRGMVNETVFIMKNQIVLGLCAVAAGIVVLGFCLRAGMNNFTYRDRTISARGVAERVVTANVGAVTASFSVEGDDLRGLKERALKGTDVVAEHARRCGIADSCITRLVPNMFENQPSYEGAKPEHRYSAGAGISVYSSDVKAIEEWCRRVYELVDEGLIVGAYPRYEYTGLNDVKPGMISEATGNARVAAEQFAKDSGSKIGLIKSANQGYFSIEGIDGKPQYYKRVRVVTSVEFYLND